MDETTAASEVNPLDALDESPAGPPTTGPSSDPATDPDRPPAMPATTQLSGQDEKAYRAWLERIGMTHERGGNVDEDYNGRDYDLRGFFDKYGPAEVDVKGGQHFTDEFKLPNHRTFSDQSRYAKGAYLPYAGKWDNSDNYYWGSKRYHEENVNPLDAMDDQPAASSTSSSMRSALEQTGEQLPEVTISARGGPQASWGDVASGLPTAIGGKIESKLAGVEEYRGNEAYSSARKKLWQSMILPEAVRSARDKGIPLTEDDQVVDIARHLGIRPDQFTRDWPTYANQTPQERRDFQAAQRERIQGAQPLMQEGAERRETAAQVSERYRPNMGSGLGLKSIAFDTATMIPDLLAGTAATLATGPVGGAAFMAADIAPDEYAAARNEGLDHRHAETYATLTTLASSVPEIPVFKIIDSAPAAKKIIGGIVGEKFGATATGKVLGTSVAQGITQATVQTLQEGIDEGLLDRHDSLPEALKKIAAAGLTGALAGAPMGGLHAAMHREPRRSALEPGRSTGETGVPPGHVDQGDGSQASPDQSGGLSPGAGVAPEPSGLSAGAQEAARGAGGAQPDLPSHGAQEANAGADTARPELPIEAPAQAEGAHPAQRPIPALIEPGQAPQGEERGGAPESGRPLPIKTPETGEMGIEPVKLSGADLRAALEAVEAKTISPPMLEALERMKLATRNDVNVPRLLPAGRRELAKPVPPAEQSIVPAAHSLEKTPPGSAETAPKQAETPPEVAKTEPAAPIAAPKPAEVSQIKPKRARPAPVEPDLPVSTPGNRYVEDPQLRDSLAAMKNETGWAQVGGRVVRNEETGAVTGRTTWIPNAEWWPGRPKGLTEPQVHAAVDKALAGKKLSPREQRMVEFMRDVHDERQKLHTFLPEAADMPADYDLQDSHTVPVDDAHETAMAARLAELDEGALESYAKQHEDDRQGFLRAVKAHLDAHDRETAGAGRESREETAGVAEERKGLDLFGQDTSRQQDLADEIRRRDQQRSPNKDVSADIGRAGDLFSTNANRQMDLTEGHRYENVQSHGGHDVGDIVRINAAGNTHHGERARILSIHRHAQDEPFRARVGHESGGQQVVDLGALEKHGQADLVTQLEQARQETNTEPTEAQKLAGNYKKGTVSFGGMRVAIENPRGSTRTGTSEGKAWRRKMHADYGYVKGTEGKDGDAVDVFLTGNPDSGKVFVINQNHPDGSFDEHKAILGASTKQEAQATYLKHYPKGWKGLGSMAELSTDAFREWVNSKKTKQPIRTGERRTDTAARKRVTEMTPEEMRKELLEHELTGIANRRAYIEAEKLPTQVSIDVDSLKWVNDNMGHESGNALLKAIADSLSQHSDLVYHLSGDEFALQSLHAREAHEVMAKIAEQLKGATIEVEMPDGKIVKLNGLGVSYGVGKDLHEADAALQTHKARREKEGARAPRGEAPPGATIGAREEGGEDKTGGVAEEKAALTPAQQRTADRLNELLEGAARRRAMEEQGQDLLDEMDEQGIHPRDVAKQFWDETYWKLNAENQRRFQRYVKSMGFEPGSTTGTYRDGRPPDVAQDWHDAAQVINEDLPDAGSLEGIDRGYVALMRWANQQAAGLSHGGEESLMLKEDAAKYSPLSSVAGRVEAGRTPIAPGQRSLDLFAPRSNPTPATRAAVAVERAQPTPIKAAEPSRGKTRTALVRTGHFTSGTEIVRDWRDAAHILAPLRKEPRESLMAIVLDGTGKPLAIIRHTTGTTAESLIEPHTLFGAIARVPGARAFFLGHNHPSGKINQSEADLAVAKRMHTLTRGSGIEMKGSLVVAPGHKWATNYLPGGGKEAGMREEPIRSAARVGGIEVPIQERRLTRIMSQGEARQVTTPNDVTQVIRESRVRSGVLMLDNKLQVIGVLPITEEEMLKLRTGDPATGAAHIVREFESANAAQAITFGEGDRSLNNLGGLLKQAKIGLVDTVVRNKESGELRVVGGGAASPHFFSKRNQAAGGMAVRDLERVVHQTIRESGLGANFPHVQVHEDESTLPPALLEHLEGQGGVASAVFDPATQRIHMLASGNATELEARANLWHEAVGHYGLRSAMEPARYNEVMDGIARDMPERVQATAYRNGLDLGDPTERRVAAEEVIAYAAGQILSGQAIDKPILPWYTKAVRAVKAFFGKITGTPFYDDHAIAGLVQEAHTALERGTSFNGLNEGAARSQHAERFYSPVDRAVGESKQGKASAEQWLATIKKGAGIKPEELEWLQLEPWLKSHKGPITKEELADYIRANRLELEETLHGGGGEAGEQTQDEQTQVRLAEELRAEGHEVALAEDGSLLQINFRDPEAPGGWSLYDLSNTEDREALPASIRDTAKLLDDVSLRVAAERAARAEGETRETGTTYGDYTLPGGKNYREMLLRMPASPFKAHLLPIRKAIFDRYKERIDDLETRRRDRTLPADVHQQLTREVDALREQRDAEADAAVPEQPVYKSGHWREPNILAHVRFNERTDADGKKVLFLEELQSDWHQVGRQRGYPQDAETIRAAQEKRDEAGRALVAITDRMGELKTDPRQPSMPWQQEVMAITKERSDADDRLRAAQAEYDQAKGAVPAAPFKTSWPMLIQKRMIRFAAEHGFERIAWTPGAVQNERYNLGHHLDSIQYTKEGDKWRVRAYGKDDPEAILPGVPQVLDEKGIEEHYGHDVAERITKGEGESMSGRFKEGYRKLTGEELSVGQSGMKGFYDTILPRETDKLIKKFGGKVGPAEVRTREHVRPLDEIAIDKGWGGYTSRLTAEQLRELGEIHARDKERGFGTTEAHGFDITEPMRQAALGQGFPLFARRQQALALQQPGPKGVYERIRKAVDWLVENPVSRDVRKLTAPTNLSPESKEAARVAREYLGVQAAWGQRSQEALEHFAREIDKLPVQDQLDMMDRMEQGVPQAHPELQPAADGMRKMLDHWRDKVRDLNIGALDNFIENYFPHYWADPSDAKRLVASIQGRRPLKGPASFLKRRTIPTIKEGMDAGLKPLTVNPLVMALLKTREMQRFITGVTLMKRFKEDGLAVFLKSGAPMPDGWTGIDDYSAKVRSWSEEEGGWIERGQYIMPEDAARVINNHVSSSVLKSFAPAQAFRVGANLLNALQLGFSAFHLGFTTLDAIISKTALGMESLLHGEVGKAARNFGEVALGPLAAVNNVRRGYNLLQAYTNPVGATPELAKIVKGLEVAGGRAHMDKYYMLSEGASPFRGVGVRSLAKDIHSALTQPTDRLRNVGKAVHNFAPEYATKLLRGLQALGKTHTALEIPFEVAGRLVRASTSWIMEHLVPMQKLGVFADLAKAHIDRHPNENPTEQADAMQRIWASVDNRLGEMVYDNLFWNRTFKDTLHLGVRAVGWNVGTWREIGGAPIDAMKVIDKAIRTGKITADDIGHKIPYVLAMTMTTALYGSILNYLFTGEGPKEAKDYFFPRTGGETNYGTPQRVSLPSYVKDVYEYSLRPGHTILNKLNPIWSVIGDMWSNEDFFGNPITDPDAGFWDSLGQRAEFVAASAKPFSLQGAQQLAGSEQPGFMGGVKTVAPYVGVAPAPGYVTSPDQMERRERSEREKKYASHLKYLMNKAVAKGDKEEIDRLRKEYIDAQINMKKTQVEVDKDRARSAVSRRKAATSMRQQGLPATANLVASLPLEPDAAARQYFREQAAA